MTTTKQTWAEQYVDRQVDNAWLGFRMDVADRLLEQPGGLLEITGPEGQVLTVELEDGHHVIRSGDQVVSTANADEAAFVVFQLVHEAWQVVHPTFLDSDVVVIPEVDEGPAAVVAPVLGTPESKAQLQAWVEAAFAERVEGTLAVAPDGRIPWRTKAGATVTVRVVNAGRIEIYTVLGRDVSFKKAHKVIDRLSGRMFGLKFFLVQDRLIMSQILIAKPFAPEQLHGAMTAFMADTDRLQWVAAKVLSKRAKADREAAEQELAEAHAALAEAEERAAVAERRAEFHRASARRRAVRVTAARKQLEVARRERDAATAELAKLKAVLARALGDQPARTFRHPRSGEVA